MECVSLPGSMLLYSLCISIFDPVLSGLPESAGSFETLVGLRHVAMPLHDSTDGVHVVRTPANTQISTRSRPEPEDGARQNCTWLADARASCSDLCRAAGLPGVVIAESSSSRSFLARSAGAGCNGRRATNGAFGSPWTT